MDNTLNFHFYHECYGEHGHEYPLILIPLEQTLHIWIGAEEYDVTPKELCFIPCGLGGTGATFPDHCWSLIFQGKRWNGKRQCCFQNRSFFQSATKLHNWSI